MFITVDDRGDVRVHSALTDEEIAKLVGDGLTVIEAMGTVSRGVRVAVCDEDAMRSEVEEKR